MAVAGFRRYQSKLRAVLSHESGDRIAQTDQSVVESRLSSWQVVSAAV